MAYARTDKKNPWDEYANLIMKPSVMDKIIEVLKQESAEQKEQRINKQRARRVRENKRQHDLITEEEEEKKRESKKEERKKKDYPRLNNLYDKLLEKHEDKEESFFEFNPPVEGTKYDIGMFGGSIFIPMTHANNLGELPIYIHN